MMSHYLLKGRLQHIMHSLVWSLLKEKLPKSVGAQYATGDQWRTNSRKNEEMEPKQKQHPVVDVTGDGIKAQYVKSNIA